MKKRGQKGQKIITFLLILLIVTGWLYSGFPQIWQSPPVPPKIQEVQAATAGPNYAGAAGTNSFTNPANAVGSETALCAYAYGLGAGEGGFWNTYGFSIPTGATIQGIQVEVLWSWDEDPPEIATDVGINIGKNETTLGTAKISAGPTDGNACGTTEIASRGGAADLWGLTWTPAEINATGFTVRIYNNSGNEYGLAINWIRVTVTYTTVAAATYEQSAYRWFNNDNSTGVGMPLAAENTSTTLSATGDEFRLRLLLHVTTTDAATGTDTFKLQFATSTPNGCDPNFSGETYVDVTTNSNHIRYFNNTTPADGALLTATSTDPTHGADTIINQTYEEANNFTVTSTISVGEDGIWDFALDDFSAPADTTYCFRVVKSDNSLITTSTNTKIPEIRTTASVQATWKAAENTSTTVAIGENVRLRILVANTTGTQATDYDYRLEYASKSGVSCGDDESWTTMPVTATTEHFEMTTSTYFADGDPTTAQLSNPEAYTFVAGKMVEDPSNSSGNITLPVENYTEIELVFQANANATGSYCFRLTKAGIVLNEYPVYPELEIVP